MRSLIDKQTRVLIQGSRQAGPAGVDGDARLRDARGAGVTPGKGGQDVYGLPVYDCVADALKEHPEINTSLRLGPREGTKDAAIGGHEERQDAAGEYPHRGPARLDAACIVQAGREYGVRVIGPASVGLINPIDRVKLGAIGGNDPGVFLSRRNRHLLEERRHVPVRSPRKFSTSSATARASWVGIGGDPSRARISRTFWNWCATTNARSS